jgi:serine protease Do
MALSRGAGGVLVTEIDSASPAQRGGLQVADVILEVDGIQVDSASEYLSLLRTYPPEAEIKLAVLRGEGETVAVVKLAELPRNYAFNYFARQFGIVVEEDSQGVLVSEVLENSPAARIEMRAGDRLVEIEGLRVENLQAFESRVEATLGRLPLRFTIYRGNRGYIIELP